MPSTPRFRVTQNAQFVYVHIRVPYVRVSDMEFNIDGSDFTFYCKPYLLKLHFSHNLVDNENAKAVYDPSADNGTIIAHLPKLEYNQEFEDLDLITKLMQPRKASSQQTKTNLIEVVSSSDSKNAMEDIESSRSVLDEDKRADQSLIELEEKLDEKLHEYNLRTSPSDIKIRYGFNNAYAGVFEGWHGEVSEIIALSDPESTPPADRQRLREVDEEIDFDVERYLLDFIQSSTQDDPYYQAALAFQPFWKRFDFSDADNHIPTTVQLESSMSNDGVIELLSSLKISPEKAGPLTDTIDAKTEFFDEQDRELLMRLPNKEFLIQEGSKEEKVILGGLADVLFAFTYDQLVNEGEHSVETACTISTLSSTLSWLDPSPDIHQVVRTSIRRAISYPFLRQYQLAERALSETHNLLLCGKRVVLLAFLRIYRAFETSETHYLLNSIFIQDYCVWIQSIDDQTLAQFAQRFHKAMRDFNKNDTGWDLIEMERRVLEDVDATSSEESAEEDTSGDSESEVSSDEVDRSTQEHFAAISKDNRLKIWNVSSGSLVHELRERDHLKNKYTCISWTSSPNRSDSKKRGNSVSLGRIAVGTTQGSILLWDLDRGEMTQTLGSKESSVSHSHAVQDIAFNAQGTRLYSCASQEKKALEWDVVAGKVLRSFKVSKEGGNRLCISQDDDLLAVGGNSIRVFDLSSGKKSRQFRAGIPSTVHQLNFSSCKNFLFASALSERFINIYDLEKDVDDTAMILSMPASSTWLFGNASRRVSKGEKKSKSFNFVLGAVLGNGSLQLWMHQYRKKKSDPSATAHQPIAPTCTVTTSQTEDDNNFTSAEIVCAAKKLDAQNRVLLVRGTYVKPIFEEISLVDQDRQLHSSIVLRPLSTHILMADSPYKKLKANEVSEINLKAGETKVHIPTLTERNTVSNFEMLDASTLAFQDLEDVMDETDITLEEKLDGLRDRVQQDVITRLQIIEEQESSTDSKKPDASSLSQVLEQAIHTKDKAMLEYVLRIKDQKVIQRTIKRVSSTKILTFLNFIVIKCEKTPSRCQHLCTWIRAILMHHTAYLMGQPDVVQNLSGLYQTLQHRIEMYAPLQKLSGRLSLLLGQLNDANALEDRPKEIQAVVVYNEDEQVTEEEDVDADDQIEDPVEDELEDE
uniref:Uncharacterized protein AlNc14C208G8858 n=1 Tax=Albugo laibachii Nc14 TaxID=890382 RepID=F0WR50_9STRA|nr:conserved hypothetical protein [Albugo laibachii Nc14]|eukprot:CCA23810.1 conserved hypothetical protein [Albugo laibachii Nc14]